MASLTRDTVKVGMRVRVVDTAGGVGMPSAQIGDTGTLTALSDFGCVTVTLDRNREKITRYPSRFELLVESALTVKDVKVGDRVKLAYDINMAARIGATATVIPLPAGLDASALIAVRWDDTPERRGQHHGDYYCKDFVKLSEEPTKMTFKIGDKVRLKQHPTTVLTVDDVDAYYGVIKGSNGAYISPDVLELVPVPKAPTKVRLMLDQIDQMLAKGDQDSQDLWAVLSALRGPDDQDYAKKITLTSHVRKEAFPKLWASAPMSSGVSITRDISPTKEVPPGDHFGNHVALAFAALEHHPAV